MEIWKQAENSRVYQGRREGSAAASWNTLEASQAAQTVRAEVESLSPSIFQSGADGSIPKHCVAYFPKPVQITPLVLG